MHKIVIHRKKIIKPDIKDMKTEIGENETVSFLFQFMIQKKIYNKLVILCTYTCPCTVHIHIMVDDFFVISDERNCLRTTLMDIELCNNLNSNTLQCVSPLIMSEVYRI